MKNLMVAFAFVGAAMYAHTSSGGSFRPSVAYYLDEESGVMAEYDVNELCYRTMAVCGISDGQYRRGEGPSGEDIGVQTRNAEYFFGVNKYGGRLLRSRDGLNNWEYTDWDEHLNGVVIWALESGTILISDRMDDYGVYRNTLYRSSDNGDTTEPVLTLGGDGFSSDKAFLNYWSFHQAPHGTILVAEYGQPSLLHSGRRIFRSVDDGQTFAKVWDSVEEGENYVHNHIPYYHSGLDRWVVVTGDGKRYRRFLANDYDGVAGFWYNLTQPHRTYLQPVTLLDYGHASRLLFGSDTKNQIGWVDISDGNAGQFGNLLTNWDPRDDLNLSFHVFEHNGVYYACNYQMDFTKQKNAVISVSTDTVNWVVYHRFTDNELGVLRFAGYDGSKLHLNVTDPNQEPSHFIISPAKISKQNVLVVEPGTVNMFGDPNGSSFEGGDLAGWWFSPYLTTHEITTEESCHGLASLHIGGIMPAERGSLGLFSPKVTVETGKAYQARFWIKGRNTRVEARYSPASYWPVAEPAYTLVDNKWQELILEPYTIEPDDGNSLGLNIYLGNWDPDQNSEELEVYIDSLQFEGVPGTNWHLGGVARADTQSCEDRMLWEEWTNVFTFYPSGRKEYYDGMPNDGRLYIKSWRAGDAFAELYYNAAASDPNDDDRFILSISDGSNFYSIRTKPQHFQRHAQIKFGIVCYKDSADEDKTKLKMHIANGRAVEAPAVITSEDFSVFGLGHITTCVGNKDGSEVFPGMISHDDFIAVAVRDDNIKSLLSIAGTGLLAADINGDLQINFYDLSILASQWLNVGCVWPGLCDKSDLDWSGEVDNVDLDILTKYWLAKTMFD